MTIFLTTLGAAVCVALIIRITVNEIKNHITKEADRIIKDLTNY